MLARCVGVLAIMVALSGAAAAQEPVVVDDEADAQRDCARSGPDSACVAFTVAAPDVLTPREPCVPLTADAAFCASAYGVPWPGYWPPPTGGSGRPGVAFDTSTGDFFVAGGWAADRDVSGRLGVAAVP